jgi:Pyridoxal-dependent decarboxylase, pyridoxal binding domain
MTFRTTFSLGLVLVIANLSPVTAFRPVLNSAYHSTSGKLRMAVAVEKGSSDSLETSKFLNFAVASKIKEKFGTPVFVYDEASLRSQAEKALSFPNAFGLKVRFAMKSCPNAAITQLFNGMGINFDASSGYEVSRLIRAGIAPGAISLSSQEMPLNFKDLYEKGIEFNACSLNQLETFGKLFNGGSCGIRFNPGKGSGGTGKTVGLFVLQHSASRCMILNSAGYYNSSTNCRM